MKQGTARDRAVTIAAIAGAVAVAVVVWTATRELPFLGDSCAWLSAVRGFDSPLRAFDPHLSLYRPFQHLVLWCLVQTGLDQPDTALLPGLLLHIGLVLAVLRLARTVGLDRTGQLAALATVLSFPVVQALDWVVGVNTPARALCTVMAVDAAIGHARAPSRTSGFAIVGWSLASLLTHEQGLATAALAAVAWWRFRPAGARRVDPWIAADLGLAAAWASFLLLRPARVFGLKRLAALPPNAAHAVLAFGPTDLRIELLDALRGGHGTAIAAAVVLAGAAVLVLWRSPRLFRTFLLLALIDCALPVLGSGFGQRYAYGPAAFLAVGIGALWHETHHVSRWRKLLLAALACSLWLSWLVDGWRDLGEARAGGVVARAVATDAIAARANAPHAPLLLVDLPADWGREHGVGLFGWGGRDLLKWLGLREPFRLVRTLPAPAGTDVEPMSAADLTRAVAAGAIALHFDAGKPGLRAE